MLPISIKCCYFFKNSIAEEGTAENKKSVDFVELETGEKEVPAKQEKSPKTEMGRSRSSSTSSKSSKSSRSSSPASLDDDEKISKIPVPASPKVR